MTDPELQGIAAQALNLAKRDLFQKGTLSMLVACYHLGEGLHRMDSVEAILFDKLGEDWLNHERTKDAGFATLRLATSLKAPDAMAFVSVGNFFAPTPAASKLSPEEHAAMSSSHDSCHQAVAAGLLRIKEVLCATAQNPRRVCLYLQEIDTKARSMTGQPDIQFVNQSEFGGRLKMYGVKAQLDPRMFTSRKGTAQ